MNDININLSEILKELKSLSHSTTEEVLLIIITAIILIIILIQRIYHCYAIVCKNNKPLNNNNDNDNDNDANTITYNSIQEQQLISRRC